MVKQEYEKMKKSISDDPDYKCKMDLIPNLNKVQLNNFPRDCYVKVRINISVIGKEHDDIRQLIKVHEGHIVIEEDSLKEGFFRKLQSTVKLFLLQIVIVYPGTIGGYALQDWDKMVDIMTKVEASNYVPEFKLMIVVSFIPVFTSLVTEFLLNRSKK